MNMKFNNVLYLSIVLLITIQMVKSWNSNMQQAANCQDSDYCSSKTQNNQCQWGCDCFKWESNYITTWSHESNCYQTTLSYNVTQTCNYDVEQVCILISGISGYQIPSTYHGRTASYSCSSHTESGFQMVCFNTIVSNKRTNTYCQGKTEQFDIKWNGQMPSGYNHGCKGQDSHQCENFYIRNNSHCLSSPITTHSPAPVTTHSPAPVTTHSPAPVTTHAATPVTTHAPAPVTTHKEPCEDMTTHAPAPVTTHSAAPVTTHAPAPVTTHAPAPVTTHAPAPVTTQAPKPVTTHQEPCNDMTTHAPAPVTTHSAAPVTTHAPVPVTTQAPVPVTTHAPVPVTTQAPVPVTTQAPVPVTTQAPAPVTTQAPAPVTTQAPAPVTTQAPRPITSSSVTSSPLSTGRLTTQAFTSNAVTSQPLTTQAITSKSITSSAVTSKSITSSAITSQSITTSAIPIPPPSCVSPFNNLCSGLNFDLSHSPSNYHLNFNDYDVISFGDIDANSGDIEGRLAVKENLYFGNGVSVGAEISENQLLSNNVTVIVGDNMYWGDGSIFPLDSSAFVGGNVQAPSYISEMVYNENCINCLDNAFNAAQLCYESQSNYFASQTVNSQMSVLPQTGGLMLISCDSSSSDVYYMSIDASQFNQASYYNIDSSCNLNSQYVITITGSSDVNFQGNNLPDVGGIIFNIPGDRNVNVNTQVIGSLLMPQATLNQVGGVIVGKVIAADIEMMLQINLPCNL